MANSNLGWLEERACVPLTADCTHGILQRHPHKIYSSSDRLGWRNLYVSHQREQPYSDSFAANRFHLLVFHLDGPIKIERELDGRRDQARVLPGGIFYLPAARDFSVAVHSSLETLHIYLDHDLVRAAAGELCAGDPDTIEFIPRMGRMDSSLESLGRMIHNMLQDGQSDFFSDGAARMLAAQLVREHSTGNHRAVTAVGGLSAKQLMAVQDLIQDRMEESICVEELATAAALSPIHFARQFKKSTGQAPHQYLIEARIKRAMHLLQSDLSLAEIAYRCGFTHQEHMTRLFGRKLGMTPGAYRKELRGS